MDHERVTREFRAQGFSVVRGLFTPEETARLAELVQSTHERFDGNPLTRDAMEFRSSLFHESEEIRGFLTQPRVIELMTTLGGPDLWIRWDQAVGKAPGAGTFPWHQDNTYSRLVDEHLQLWIALTPMTADQGALWIEPKRRRSLVAHVNNGFDDVAVHQPRTSVCVVADPGDVVVFSSYSLHSTTPNVTDSTRWAYVIEFMKLQHVDPFIPAPHFVVARDGAPAPEFVDHVPNEGSLRNRVAYSWPVNHARTLASRQLPKYLAPRARRRAAVLAAESSRTRTPTPA